MSKHSSNWELMLYKASKKNEINVEEYNGENIKFKINNEGVISATVGDVSIAVPGEMQQILGMMQLEGFVARHLFRLNDQKTKIFLCKKMLEKP